MSDNKLVKKMSFWHIWALGVGAVVGDGIFLMVAQGAQAAGPAASVSYLLGGVMIMIVCMVISEMAVGMPGAGSLHTWSKRVLGPVYGVLAGLCEVSMNIVFLGSVSIAAGAISNYFFQWTGNSNTSAIIWAVLILTIVVGIALCGGEITGKAQLGLVILLVGIMAAFAIGGLASGKIASGNYQPFAPFGAGGIWIAMGMGIYAYMGPLTLLSAGGEVKEIRHLPKAMFWAFVTFLTLYTTAIVVMIGLVNYQGYGSMESPFTVAAGYIFGSAAGIIVNFAAWIAAVTSLIGEIFCASRLLFGMAEDGALPKFFGKLNKRKVPWAGLLFAYVIALGIIVIGNLRALESFYLMIGILGCVVGTVTIIISVISSLLYKRRFPEEWKALPWHLPMRKVMFPLAFIGCGMILYSLFSSSPTVIPYSIGFIALLVIFYKLYSAKGMKKVEQARAAGSTAMFPGS